MELQGFCKDGLIKPMKAFTTGPYVRYSVKHYKAVLSNPSEHRIKEYINPPLLNPHLRPSKRYSLEAGPEHQYFKMSQAIPNCSGVVTH